MPLPNFISGQKAAGVIAYSSRNHAQTIALSARLQGIKSIIVMPTATSKFFGSLLGSGPSLNGQPRSKT
jgi:cysteine synthase